MDGREGYQRKDIHGYIMHVRGSAFPSNSIYGFKQHYSFFPFFLFFCRQGEKICSHEPWQGQACEEAWSGTGKRMPQSNLGCVVPQDWCGERDNDNASGCGNCTIFWVPSWKQRPRCTIPRRKRFTVAQKPLPERRREVFYQPPPARFIPHWHARDAPSRVGDGSRRKRAFNSVYVEKNKL